MNPSITVYVNGEPHAVAADLSLAALVETHTQARSGVAAAVNGEVVRRADWPDTALGEGARVEILTAVQGG